MRSHISKQTASNSHAFGFRIPKAINVALLSVLEELISGFIETRTHFDDTFPIGYNLRGNPVVFLRLYGGAEEIKVLELAAVIGSIQAGRGYNSSQHQHNNLLHFTIANLTQGLG